MGRREDYESEHYSLLNAYKVVDSAPEINSWSFCLFVLDSNTLFQDEEDEEAC